MKDTEVKNSNLENFNEYPSLKNIFLKTKLYAEKNNGLVIGVITLLLSGLAIYLNLCFYSYKLGGFIYYGIDPSYISIGNQTDSLMQILLLLSASVIILLFIVLSYISYCRGFFRLYILVSFFLIYIIFVSFGLIKIKLNLDDIKLAIYLFSVWFIFNLCGVILALTHYNRVRIYRCKIKIQKLENKCPYCNSAKINKYKNKLAKYISEEQNSKFKENKVNIDVKFNLISEIIPFICVLAIPVCAFYFKGYSNMSKNKNMHIIENQIDKVYTCSIDEKKFIIDDYTVLYQNNDFMIVSPCIIEDKKISIFNSYQIMLDKKSFMIQNKNFDNIVFLNDDIELEGEKNGEP